MADSSWPTHAAQRRKTGRGGAGATTPATAHNHQAGPCALAYWPDTLVWRDSSAVPCLGTSVALPSLATTLWRATNP